MSGPQTYLGVLALAASVVAFSQNNETTPPESVGVTGSQPPTPTAANPCASQQKLGQPEILTDTMGVNFGPYMTTIVKTISQNWFGLVPPLAYGPIFKQGRVAIEFVVQKDGKIDKIQIDTSTGEVQLDRAASASISKHQQIESASAASRAATWIAFLLLLQCEARHCACLHYALC
jgi:TonB family protein